MPNGTVMSGPPHGPGQQCIETSDGPIGAGYSVGGMLVGPSHEEGGIPVIVDGTEPIEVEGGEFVINAKTVEALGEDFLHKLNSTSTPYHTGGYQQGQLPMPSQFRMGGKIDYKTKQKMQSGGSTGGKRKKMSINSRKMEMGGPVHTPRNKNKISARAKRRLKQSKDIRGRVGGAVSRISSLSANHTHTITMDEDGYGETIGGTHFHTVRGGMVEMTCPGNGIPCHSHE
jgi:hypothetical protein